MTTNITARIIEEEWQMFTITNSMGGRSCCQDQKGNFIASRTAYWGMFSEDILHSYSLDLVESAHNQINLITQKYAYMMRSTDPMGYEKIKQHLMPLSEQKEDTVNAIMLIYMEWEEELQKQGGTKDEHHRKLYAKYDTPQHTSVETYMRGELCSYSLRTLQKILLHFLDAFTKRNNLVEGYIKRLNTYLSLLK